MKNQHQSAKTHSPSRAVKLFISLTLCIVLMAFFNPLSAAAVPLFAYRSAVEKSMPVDSQSETVDSALPPDIHHILERGTLVVAMLSRDNSPFFVEDDAGEMEGLDVELAQAIANQLTVGLKFDRSARTFDDVVDQVLNTLQGDRSGEAFIIINANQELIASTDPNEVSPVQSVQNVTPMLKHFSDTQNPLLQHASSTLALQSVSLEALQSWQRYFYVDSRTNQKYYISLPPLGYLDWTIGTVIPEADYLISVKRNRRLLPIVISGFIGVTACLAMILSDRIIAYPTLKIARAAADVEAASFKTNCLDSIARRRDELGQLARVFQTMAHEVCMREHRLKQQVKELRIEIDDVKRQKQVREIVESDFFRT
ncbi:MAG: transporter substrate-binding domain-containing protein [Elainellaceae cyanobacterium]